MHAWKEICFELGQIGNMDEDLVTFYVPSNNFLRFPADMGGVSYVPLNMVVIKYTKHIELSWNLLLYWKGDLHFRS